MADLREFSKILIFKNTEETRFYFGTPNRTSNQVADSGIIGYKEFNSSYPPADILTNTSWNADTGQAAVLSRNLLHSIGVEESSSLGFNIAPQSSGTAIIFDDKLYVGGGSPTAWTYNEETSFASPSPALAVGDFIFWGEDPNNLKLGGKIKTIYAVGSAEYTNGARYLFEKSIDVDFPTHPSGTYINEPIPQDIYYYRKTWNGKGLKTDVTEGFYVLIGVELENNQRAVYPWLDPNGTGTSDNRIVNGQYAFTDLIRVKRISNRFKSDETTQDSEQLIPCSIQRTNWFTNGSISNSLYQNVDQIPFWLAYFVNPYAETASLLDKNTTYVIEVSERLPALIYGPQANNTALYSYAIQGVI